MRCRSYRRAISRQLDGHADDDRALFEHRGGCVDCRRWHGLVVGARQALAGPPAEVPADLAARVARAVLTAAAAPRRAPTVGELADRLVRVGRVGLAAAALAAVGLLALAAASSGGAPERAGGPVDLTGEGVDPAAALIAGGDLGGGAR
jgi:hypothetical protein